MKRYNNAEMFFEDYKSVTDDDKKEIIKALEAEIEIHVDEQGRVWNEGNVYIADVTKIKKNKEENGMANWEKQDRAWWKWEDEQVEKYEGEVFVSKTMDSIPWHSNNTRRYNIYNNDDLDIIVDTELIEEEGEYKVIEL